MKVGCYTCRLQCVSPEENIGSIDPEALKILAPLGRNTTLTENVAPPFQTEPKTNGQDATLACRFGGQRQRSYTVPSVQTKADNFDDVNHRRSIQRISQVQD